MHASQARADSLDVVRGSQSVVFVPVVALVSVAQRCASSVLRASSAGIAQQHVPHVPLDSTLRVVNLRALHAHRDSSILLLARVVVPHALQVSSRRVVPHRVRRARWVRSAIEAVAHVHHVRVKPI